ncbi:MAG: DUF4827 domain-containing protein [Bacteroidaceae bacterium]|nr:DUF4827 domain-containing protein [Bacteroidaceae bacterium]
MKLNTLKYILFLPLFALSFVSCDDAVTYSEMKDKERDAVKKFVKEKGIKVISYEEFIANDTVTDVSKNEFVEIDGVYMQIVNNPKDADDARRINDGDTRNMLVRYTEYNIQEGDTISGNKFVSEPDEMRVSNASGTFSATFTSGIMASVYGSAVPTGWLTPFTYLYFTRKQGNLAAVNLIVPHTKGTVTATTYVYPCLYSITFQPENLYDFEDAEEGADNADVE